MSFQQYIHEVGDIKLCVELFRGPLYFLNWDLGIYENRSFLHRCSLLLAFTPIVDKWNLRGLNCEVKFEAIHINFWVLQDKTNVSLSLLFYVHQDRKTSPKSTALSFQHYRGRFLRTLFKIRLIICAVENTYVTKAYTGWVSFNTFSGLVFFPKLIPICQKVKGSLYLSIYSMTPSNFSFRNSCIYWTVFWRGKVCVEGIGTGTPRICRSICWRCRQKGRKSNFKLGNKRSLC